MNKMNDILKYFVKNGWEILIEQRSMNNIKRGDKIVGCDNFYPIPDGFYKIKGRLFGLKVKNNIIV